MPSSPPDTRRPYIGRFAPSPTGPLHFGSLVAALASHLDARQAGGHWLVRMEDVDETRCQPAWADHILRQLEALGLTWDGPVMVQSQRKEAYEAALQALLRQGIAYPCTCSRKDISAHALPGLDGPIYPGTCSRGGALPSLPAAWRLRTDDAVMHFDDAVQGPQSQVLAREVGDFVIKRRDGLFAYQLAVVVDDIAQSITHVVRGADLLDSTPRQIRLLQALGAAIPEYSHVPVAVNAAGQKLSKQTLAPGLDENASPRQQVELINAALVFLGQSPVEAATPAGALAAAIPAWDAERIPRHSVRPAPSSLSA